MFNLSSSHGYGSFYTLIHCLTVSQMYIILSLSLFFFVFLPCTLGRRRSACPHAVVSVCNHGPSIDIDGNAGDVYLQYRGQGGLGELNKPIRANPRRGPVYTVVHISWAACATLHTLVVRGGPTVCYLLCICAAFGRTSGISLCLTWNRCAILVLVSRSKEALSCSQSSLRYTLVCVKKNDRKIRKRKSSSCPAVTGWHGHRYIYGHSIPVGWTVMGLGVWTRAAQTQWSYWAGGCLGLVWSTRFLCAGRGNL